MLKKFFLKKLISKSLIFLKKQMSWALKVYIFNNKYSSWELLFSFLGTLAWVSRLWCIVLCFTLKYLLSHPFILSTNICQVHKYIIYPWKRDKLYLNSCSKVEHSFGRTQKKVRLFPPGESQKISIGVGITTWAWRICKWLAGSIGGERRGEGVCRGQGDFIWVGEVKNKAHWGQITGPSVLG